MSNLKSFNSIKRRPGFTLVELLITLTILAILAVIIIPSVRILSRDRKVRDTARIIGSSFAAAREQAAIDGLAGVRIETNSNVSANYGSTIYRLRALPPYTGDFEDHAVSVTALTPPPDSVTPGSATLTFSRAGSALPRSNTVTDLDEIEVNNSGVFYRVTSGGNGAITIAIEPSDPLLPYNAGTPFAIELPFKVHARPIPIQSSVIQLPDRLFLNMALSGHGFSGTQFGGSGTVEIWFDQNGAVDRIDNNGTIQFPQGSVYLLMCIGDGDEVDITNLNSNLTDSNTLQYIGSGNNLWIVVERKNGNVSIGRMGNIDPNAPSIGDARSLARNRRSATP